MHNVLQAVFSKRRKHDVHVIGHHAPSQDSVALAMKVLDGIGHDPGDSRVAHVARAQPAVEIALGLSQQDPEFLETYAVRNRKATRLPGLFQDLTLLPKPGQQIARERIG